MRNAGARRLREDDYEDHEPARHLRAVGATDSVARAQRPRGVADRPPRLPDRPRADVEYMPVYAENGRRTVTVTGHPVPARRRAAIARSHVEARPDRIALWAFLLGLFLVFMAVAMANATAL